MRKYFDYVILLIIAVGIVITFSAKIAFSGNDVSVPSSVDSNWDFKVELPDLKDAVTVDATEFGMRPGAEDNTDAFNIAINYCKKYKSAILEIPRGIYSFNNSRPILVDKMNNFCINGNNSEFIFSDFGMFSVSESDHVLLKNIIIDWDWDLHRLASLAKVIAVGPDFVDFEFPELQFVDEKMSFFSMNQYDIETLTPGCEGGQELWTGQLIAKKVTPVLSNQLRIYPAEGSFPNMVVGQVYSVRHYSANGTAVKTYCSSNVTYQHIKIYSSPGGCFLVEGTTHHLRLDSCTVSLRPGANRRMSANGDVFHVAQSKGYLIIENCDFSFMGDDGCNIHDVVGFVTDRATEYALRLDNKYPGNPGDKFDVRRPDFSSTGDIVKLARRIDMPDGGVKLFFTSPVPLYITSNYMLVNQSFKTSNYIIRNNYIHHNRARGLLLQCSNGLIENNKFECTQGAAIYVMMEILRNLWYEGTGVDNVIVRNNEFINCNVNNWTSVVDIMAVLPDKESTFPVFTNLVFENNQFREFPSGVFYINKAKNVTIRNNTFESNLSRKINRLDRGYIFINHSSGINIKDNRWMPSPYISSPGYINLNPDGDGSPNRASYY